MSIKNTVLLIEDEEHISRVIETVLNANGYHVIATRSGISANSLIPSHIPDVILLDLGLPDLDGMEILKSLRQWSDIPVIVISARDMDKDKIAALDLGADDYITKPFSPREVVARVKAVLRRWNQPLKQSEILRLGQLQIDVRAHTTFLAGQPVDLTPAEFQLLVQLIAEPERAFQRLELLESTQGGRFEGYERTIDIHVKNIRQKFKAIDPETNYIRTVFGVGYRAGKAEK